MADAGVKFIRVHGRVVPIKGGVQQTGKGKGVAKKADAGQKTTAGSRAIAGGKYGAKAGALVGGAVGFGVGIMSGKGLVSSSSIAVQAATTNAIQFGILGAAGNAIFGNRYKR